MQTIELERAAYITNDPHAALLARIADLERQNVIYANVLTRIADSGPAMSGDECALMAYEVL